MAEWKLCSDKGLSALPAAISERCHRYGDGRLFSLIIGNCECVSVPVHRYSNIKDTCQRKPVLWIWWAQQLLWKCMGLCLLCTHRHLTDEGSRQRSWCGHQTVHERALKEKSFDRKFVSLSLIDKTKAYVRSVELRRSERDKKKKKKNQWYCSRRDVWGLHAMLSLWWYLTLKRSWEMCSREGGLVTSHCSKLDDMQLFTT